MKGMIIVTGTTKRVGHHVARKLLDEGYQVVAIYRTRSEAVEDLEKRGAAMVSCDLTDRQSLMRSIGTIRLLLKDTPLRAIIHNASAYYATSESLDKAMDEFDEFYRVHMLAPYVINESFREALTSNGLDHADIIHITDICADNPVPENDIYCATKAGLASLTKSLAKKYAPVIQVNAVAPASLYHSDYSEDEREELLKRKLLLNKEGGSESVYMAIQYLLNHHFTTGTVLNVDGGRSIR